jgi:hypothetical protein
VELSKIKKNLVEQPQNKTGGAWRLVAAALWRFAPALSTLTFSVFFSFF